MLFLTKSAVQLAFNGMTIKQQLGGKTQEYF